MCIHYTDCTVVFKRAHVCLNTTKTMQSDQIRSVQHSTQPNQTAVDVFCISHLFCSFFFLSFFFFPGHWLWHRRSRPSNLSSRLAWARGRTWKSWRKLGNCCSLCTHWVIFCCTVTLHPAFCFYYCMFLLFWYVPFSFLSHSGPVWSTLVRCVLFSHSGPVRSALVRPVFCPIPVRSGPVRSDPVRASRLGVCFATLYASAFAFNSHFLCLFCFMQNLPPGRARPRYRAAGA